MTGSPRPRQVFALPATGWDGVTLVWAGHGRLGIELVAEQRQGAAMQGVDTEETAEIAVGTAYSRQLLELTTLGLADADGNPNRYGRTLERLCRGHGMLPGQADDEDVLELAQVLRRLFATTRDPLQWDEQPRRWIAICDLRLAPGA